MSVLKEHSCTSHISAQLRADELAHKKQAKSYYSFNCETQSANTTVGNFSKKRRENN